MRRARARPLSAVAVASRPMASATVGDHELYYERAGMGEPLLLIMGMSGTHLTWGEPFPEALRRDFEVVVYDHRGIGRASRAGGGYTIAAPPEAAPGLPAPVAS